MKEKIEVLKKQFLKIVLTVLLFFISWIVITGILEYNKVVFRYNPIYLCIGILMYILILRLIYKKIIDRLLQYHYLPYILFSIFLIFSIISGMIFKVNPTWDMGTVFEIAKEYVNEGTINNTFYLAQFPNNTMMLCIDIVIMKVFKLFHISDYLTGITIVTAIIITLSVIITYYIAKKILGDKKALMFLIIAIFTTPLYLYASVYYTDTFSMLLVVLLFYVWLILREERNKKRKVALQILYGIILFLAYELKLTSAFIYIAIVMYEICNTNIKTVIKNNCIVIPITIICIVSFKFVILNNLTTEEERDKYQIPTEHWIMMGMNGVGSFEYKEYEYTIQYPTLEERAQADRQMIMKRLKERTINEHIKNITRKLGYTWHDGTFFIPDILRREPVNKNILHEFVLEDGKYDFLYKYIPQVMHFSMLIFIIINLKRIIENKEYNSKEIVGMITIFGVMMFLIIWENRSRYLVNIIPLMILMQINGIDYFSYKKKNLPDNQKTH